MDPSRRSARDNGLRCPGYAAIGDFDPRVADALLEELRTFGIAAYVTPTPGNTGGYLETKLPSGLTDRLFADNTKVEQAKGVVDSEHPARAQHETGAAASADADELDIDAAWQQLLVSLQTPSTATTGSWPASEDLPTTSVHTFAALPTPDQPPAADVLDDTGHYEPPPPPPLPRFERVTIVSWLAILGGLAIVILNVDGGSLTWLALLAILSGAIALIWHVKQGPPTDSGWDDGAVV